MVQKCGVLVLGAGAAGMPAAIFAAEQGAHVILVEAAERIGGTFHLSSGQMSAAGTRVQAAKGIKDSAEDHFLDAMRINRGTGNPAIIKLAINNAADTFHWLLDNGLEILPEHPIVHFGHEPYSTPRTYWGPEEGRSVLKVLAPQVEKAVQEGRIDLRLNTRLEGFKRNDDGTLSVQLQSNASSYMVEAESVILATGGFSANPELFQKLSDGKRLYGGGSHQSRGDGLVAALDAGGVVVNEKSFLPTFAAVADASAHGGYTFVTQTYPQYREPWEIYVDPDGRRFIREDDPSVDARERALLELPGMRFWMIFDERVRQEAPTVFTMNSWEEMAPKFNHEAAYQKADTLDELAALIGADPAKLTATVNDYNSALLAGETDPMGRKHRPLPIKVGPYYAIEHVGWSIVSFAGLSVDPELRVIDGEGNPIPGLYAAGEILGMGATSGNAFVGGMSVTPAMTFGRLLGSRLGRKFSQ
nr:FAD-dependent oxidoreductase [Sphingomonas sp. Y57]